MKRVLVTGASGYLGHHLVKKFLDNDVQVVAVLGRPEDKANVLPDSPNLSIIPCDRLYSTDYGHVDTLIHTAFARGENFPGLASSIEMTRKVIELVNEQDINSFVNISSQGVYKGLNIGEKVNENGIVEPNTTYGLMKWSVENMLTLGCRKHYVNIRMASLSANARFLVFFVNRVKERMDIVVTAPNQYASIMDVSDAVDGIFSICCIPIQERANIYNLGPGEQHSILEYANTVVRVGNTFGFVGSKVIIEDKGSNYAICMDCSRICNQTNWMAKNTIESVCSKFF